MFMLKDDILSNFDKIKHNSNMSVSTKSVSEIIGKLECGKPAGPDGIGAEYLKFSNIKIHIDGRQPKTRISKFAIVQETKKTDLFCNGKLHCA